MLRRRLVSDRRSRAADPDGYFWFVGRNDDVIKTSGHLVGPFEVESVLMEHPAVAEAGVIGNPIRSSANRQGIRRAQARNEPSEALRRELLGFARGLGAAVAPKEIDFVANLPKTRSGKIIVACSRPVSWAFPKATHRLWKSQHENE